MADAKLTISSSEEMIVLGQELAKKHKNGAVICLYGKLGSGKNNFCTRTGKRAGYKAQNHLPYLYYRARV